MVDQASVNGLRLEMLSDTPDAQSTTVRVAGEIDAGNASAFRDVLEMASEPGRSLWVDMGDVSFIDSSGVNVLLSSAPRDGSGGRRLQVRNPSSNVRKILEILGLTDHFGLPDGSTPSDGAG